MVCKASPTRIRCPSEPQLQTSARARWQRSTHQRRSLLRGYRMAVLRDVPVAGGSRAKADANDVGRRLYCHEKRSWSRLPGTATTPSIIVFFKVSYSEHRITLSPPAIKLHSLSHSTQRLADLPDRVHFFFGCRPGFWRGSSASGPACGSASI